LIGVVISHSAYRALQARRGLLSYSSNATEPILFQTIEPCPRSSPPVIDKNAIFSTSLKKCGLRDGQGTVPLTSLKNAFICMRQMLEEQRTTVSDERKVFLAAIRAAIDDDPSLTDAHRKAAHETLDSAFDIVRKPEITTITGSFLSRVKF
jgi:hypothetical protein